MKMRFWLGFVLAAAIAAGAVALALVVHNRDVESFERAQQSAATRASRQLEALASLTTGQLRASAAFLQVDERLNRHEFAVLSRSLLREGALSATAVAETGRRCCSVSKAATQRGVLPPDAAPIGRDLFAEAVHARAIRAARDTGEAATTPVTLDPIRRARSIVVYQPVYRDGAPTATVAQRRRAFTELAVGVVSLPSLAAGLEFTLPESMTAQLLEGGEPVVGPAQPLAGGASTQVRLADRTWVLVVRDAKRPGVSLPALIAVVGISLAALLAALVLVWSRHEQMVELQRQASHDPLTGLKNRRRFSEDLGAELSRSRRHASEGAVMMLDIDNFKRVNDTLGHPTGDRVIAEIAAVLASRMRDTDVVGRLGGDEFGVVLPHCDRQEAQGVAESIAAAVREHRPSDGDVPPVTVSIGIALFGPDDAASGESLLSVADRALYEAKGGGGDSIRLAGEPAAQPQHASD